MSQFQIVHFKYTSGGIHKRFCLVQPSFDVLINKLKTLSTSFKYLEVQDKEGDWVRVDNEEEWHYMKMILNVEGDNPYHVRNGGEFEFSKDETPKNVVNSIQNSNINESNSTTSKNNSNQSNGNSTAYNTISTLGTLGGAAVSSAIEIFSQNSQNNNNSKNSSSPSLTGVLANALGTAIVNSVSSNNNSNNSNNSSNNNSSNSSVSSTVVQNAIPTLLNYLAKNPQLIKGTVSTLSYLGTQGASLIQSEVLSAKKSNTNNKMLESSTKQKNANTIKSNQSTSSDDVVASVLLEVLKAGNYNFGSENTSSHSNQITQNSNLSHDLNNSSTNDSNVKYHDHIEQGLNLVENLLKKVSDKVSQSVSSSNLSNSSNSIENKDISSSENKSLSKGEVKQNTIEKKFESTTSDNTTSKFSNEVIQLFSSIMKSNSQEQQIQNQSQLNSNEQLNQLNVLNNQKYQPEIEQKPISINSNLQNTLNNIQSKPSTNQNNLDEEPIHIDTQMLTNLSLLTSMNFKNTRKNVEALKTSGNNLHAAVQLLLHDQKLNQ